MKTDMDKKIKTALVFAFFVLAFIFIVSYVLFSELHTVVFIFANICTAAYVYYLVQYIFNKRLEKNVNELANELNKLLNENENTCENKNYDARFGLVYKKLDFVKETLNQRERNQAELRSIVNSVAVNIELDKLLSDIMPKLVAVTKSNCGAFYLANQAAGKLEIKFSIGFSKNIYSEFDLSLGEGFIGTAALKKEISVINDIPEDTVYIIRTFLGKIKPKSVVVVPILSQDEVVGCLVLASVYNYTDEQLELIKVVKYYLGVAVSNGITYDKAKRLTSELRFQNQLIQNLNDDLERRVQERIKFLNDILDSITEYAIYATDRDGIVVTWNKGAELLYGFNAKQIIGKHVNQFFTERDQHSVTAKQIHSKVLEKGICNRTLWYTKRDGSSYFADMTIFARYGENGELIGFTNVTKDITNFKKLENELHYERELSARMIDSDTKALVFLSSEGVVQMNNRNAEKMLRASGIIGKSFYDFFENDAALKIIVNDASDNENEKEGKFKLKGLNEYVKICVNLIKNLDDTERRVVVYIS